jgi:ATP-binding cassette subfamily B protein
MAATRQINPGDVVIITSYVWMLLWPVRQLGRMLSDFGKSTVSVNRIFEILEEPLEDMTEDGKVCDLNQDIVFENVGFEYEAGKPVLKDISFTAPKGSTIAILGSTGTGKSSMVLLLQRLYDYQKGSIRIGGVELKEINKHWLRKNVGIVLQEPFLYSRNLKENITFARQDADEDMVSMAVKTASLERTIQEFEEGFETMVGERGVTLSGGQKQRVAIARTIIRDCPILIFDDSLSAVDTHTDAQIRAALKERSRDITTFIISHRINTLAEADWILVIRDGKIIEQGRHSDLISKRGYYFELYTRQFEEDAGESVLKG